MDLENFKSSLSLVFGYFNDLRYRRCGGSRENIVHDIRDCPFSNEVLILSSIGNNLLCASFCRVIDWLKFATRKLEKEDFTSLSLFLWQLLEARNFEIIQRKTISPQDALIHACTLHKGFRAHNLVCASLLLRGSSTERLVSISRSMSMRYGGLRSKRRPSEQWFVTLRTWCARGVFFKAIKLCFANETWVVGSNSTNPRFWIGYIVYWAQFSGFENDKYLVNFFWLITKKKKQNPNNNVINVTRIQTTHETMNTLIIKSAHEIQYRVNFILVAQISSIIINHPSITQTW